MPSKRRLAEYDLQILIENARGFLHPSTAIRIADCGSLFKGEIWDFGLAVFIFHLMSI